MPSLRKSTGMLALAAIMAACAFATEGLALTGSAGVVKLTGNHPTELARLGPMMHADSAMMLHLTVVLGIHDRTKLDQLLTDQQNPSSS